MTSAVRERDLERERKERECFIVLQHVYTITGSEPLESVPSGRIASDLGFDERACGEIVEHLVRIGYLRWTHPGLVVTITPEGSESIERLAWRRRSVRSGETRQVPPAAG